MDKGIILNLSGFYNHNGRSNKLNGSIYIAPEGAFTGEVYDYRIGLRNPEQEIKGHIVKEGNMTKLLFLKFPFGQNKTNLLYKLESKITKNQPFSFVNNFEGRWQILPYKVEYNKNYNLFMAQMDNSIVSVGDKAEINITA